MKKLLCVLLIVLTLVSLAACGKSTYSSAAASPETAEPAPVETETDQTSVPSPSVPSGGEAALTPSPKTESSDQRSEALDTEAKSESLEAAVDVDLTALSSTMVYSEVYNMMVNAESYIGKTVKMKGQFAMGYSDNADGTTDIRVACIIMDATACCSQGLGFVLTGDHTYPEDYPELGSEITVTGTFELYEENGFQYCRLVDAEMTY